METSPPSIRSASATPLTQSAKKNMIFSCADGAAYSMMVGCGETYIAAFALAIGMSQITAGLTGTVPLLAGGVLQLIGPAGARWCRSYRRWVLICATLQGAAFLPMTYAAMQGTMSAVALFATCALYWGFGMAAGPAWNNWIDRIIPKHQLCGFFTTRARLTQLAAFLAFLVAGYALVVFQNNDLELRGFATLFAVATACRFVSCICLRLQSDAPALEKAPERIQVRRMFTRFFAPQASRFLLFLLISQISVNIGGAFFAPYMLGHAHFPYNEYVAIVGASYLAKIAMLPLISVFVQRIGSYRALCMAAICIAPTPLFWFLTPNLYPLIFLQFYAGTVWAVYELASTLLIFERIAAAERLQILTVFNLLNAAAVVTGSLIGGGMLHLAPVANAYPYIFSLSAAARLLATSVLWRPSRWTSRWGVERLDSAPNQDTLIDAA